jgi:dodecin
MSEHVYKTIELTGSSTESSDEAVRHAMIKVGFTLED